MSEPSEVPPTAAQSAPSRSRRGNSWAEVADVCTVFVFILVVFLGWRSLPRAEAIALGVIMGPVILSVVLSCMPCARYPGDYPPLAPPRPGSRWLVRLPGVGFWTAFSFALFVLHCVGLGIIGVAGGLWESELDRKWVLWGVAATYAVEIGAAIPLAFALRSCPELEVDEERREAIWRPNSVWAGPVVLPFDAIEGVRVVDTGRTDTLICYPEITWRSRKGRVRKTRLPISGDREGVQEVAARLQAAVFSTTSPASSSDGSRPT